MMHSLERKRIIVYDAETKNAVDGQEITWDDHHKMGISVICAFDYYDGDYKVFLEDNLDQFVELMNSCELVVGHNIIGFDNPLLRAHGYKIREGWEWCYDTLHYSRRATGWNIGDPLPRGLRLNDHLSVMFGDAYRKTEDGADAPGMYQRGEMGRLISYCLADVRREKLLFEHMGEYGWVETQAHGKRNVITPQEVIEFNRKTALAMQQKVQSSC